MTATGSQHTAPDWITRIDQASECLQMGLFFLRRQDRDGAYEAFLLCRDDLPPSSKARYLTQQILRELRRGIRPSIHLTRQLREYIEDAADEAITD